MTAPQGLGTRSRPFPPKPSRKLVSFNFFVFLACLNEPVEERRLVPSIGFVEPTPSYQIAHSGPLIRSPLLDGMEG